MIWNLYTQKHDILWLGHIENTIQFFFLSWCDTQTSRSHSATKRIKIGQKTMSDFLPLSVRYIICKESFFVYVCIHKVGTKNPSGTTTAWWTEVHFWTNLGLFTGHRHPFSCCGQHGGLVVFQATAVFHQSCHLRFCVKIAWMMIVFLLQCIHLNIIACQVSVRDSALLAHYKLVVLQPDASLHRSRELFPWSSGHHLRPGTGWTWPPPLL